MKPKWTELKEETNTQIPLSVFHRTSRQSIRKNPEDLPKSFLDPSRSRCQDCSTWKWFLWGGNRRRQMHSNHGTRLRGKKGRLGRKSPRLQNSSKKVSCRPRGVFMPVGRVLHLLSKKNEPCPFTSWKQTTGSLALVWTWWLTYRGSHWSFHAREEFSDTFSWPPGSTLCITDSLLGEASLWPPWIGLPKDHLMKGKLVVWTQVPLL